MLCLHYTLCLIQLYVVHNLILVGFWDWFPVSGLLVIDAVGWWSMYLVVMPIVNLIVILSTYACYRYSINCPTVICLPSTCYFILWRDTTNELWTPVLFPLYCYYLFTLLALFTFLHITIVFHSICSFLCLQQTGEIFFWKESGRGDPHNEFFFINNKNPNSHPWGFEPGCLGCTSTPIASWARLIS
jgi:hypothetical protein